jgi:hypothetical protein
MFWTNHSPGSLGTQTINDELKHWFFLHTLSPSRDITEGKENSSSK